MPGRGGQGGERGGRQSTVASRHRRQVRGLQQQWPMPAGWLARGPPSLGVSAATPKAGRWRKRKGRAAAACHNFHVVPSAAFSRRVTSGLPEPEARGGRGSGRGAEGAGGRRGGRGQAGSGGGGSLCRWNPQREANGQSHDNRQSNVHQCHLPKGTASLPPPAASAPTRPRARTRLQGTQATQRGAGLAPYPGLGTPGGRERLGWALTLALFARDANMFTNVMSAAFPPSTPPLPAGRLPGPPMAPFQTPVPVAIFCLV